MTKEVSVEEVSTIFNPADICPNCKAAGPLGRFSVNLNWNKSSGRAVVEEFMECDECGTTWEQLYTYSGMVNIVIP